MRRILLIEDEESLRKVIQLNLELEQFEVRTAKDGDEALTLIATEYFDLIVLDLMLPKLSGLDVLKSLRLKNEHIPGDYKFDPLNISNQKNINRLKNNEQIIGRIAMIGVACEMGKELLYQQPIF